MKNLLAIIFIVAFPFGVSADDSDLVGTYKLISATRKVLQTGEVDDVYGKNPSGLIMYGTEGRFLVLITYGNRPKPETIDKITDEQRTALFRTMVSYGGTYKYDGKSVHHQIDISWNEVWTGTTVIRDVTRGGDDRLVYTTRPAPFSGDGKMSVVTLVWEKVQ